MGRKAKTEEQVVRHEGDPVICSRCGASVSLGKTRVAFFQHYSGHGDQKIVMNCRFEIMDAANGENPRSVCDSCFAAMLADVRANLLREDGS